MFRGRTSPTGETAASPVRNGSGGDCDGASLAVDIVFHPVSPAVSELFQKFAASGLCFCAAALCVMRARASRGERSPWLLFALATALWGTASLYFAVFLWDLEEVPYPSVADGFWLAFYLPAGAALVALLRKRARSFTRGTWLDVLVGGLGLGGAVVALVFQTVQAHTSGTALEIATNLAYPIGDLSLLAMVVATITIVGWNRSGAVPWIASALAAFAVTDSIFLVQVAEGTYEIGGLLDLGWPVAFLLVGLAAWRPEPRVRPTAAPQSKIVLPAMLGLTALTLLVVDHFVRLSPLAIGLATASAVVMLVRLYLTVLDNTRLLSQSRREAMTDALTGLGNRRQLTADLLRHVQDLDPRRPLMLTLFDLDGFKQYNDTFGHPAGDQLLERLGGRLRSVLSGRGAAYRMGGDEFCALWSLESPDRASLATAEAQAALSERGEAFSIGCSYGSVLLPTETIDVTQALQVADRRMYILKRSGRSSAGRQSSDVLLRALAESDSELGIHLGGVATLVAATAQRLGLTPEERETARQAAFLHDVGKVAVPDEILNKPGPLDDREWAYMKRHTLIGERIISAAPALAAVAKLVRSTHERYDGGGYPDGLAGDDIPLISRIVGVCDAYDAMITSRPYQAAWDEGRAIAELRRCSGTQFDPHVVEALVGALRAAGTHEPNALDATLAPSDPSANQRGSTALAGAGVIVHA